MSSINTPTSSEDAVLLNLFENVIDCSCPETRANLRFISFPDTNGDTIEYAQIWCSLASFLYDEFSPKGIELQFPVPPFIIGEHKTHMYWYEVIYRSLRTVDDLWQSRFKPLTKKDFKLLDSYTSRIDAWRALYKDAVAILGVQRIVVCSLASFMRKYAAVDMGYDEDDASMDEKRCCIMANFAKGVIEAHDENYTRAADLFSIAGYCSSSAAAESSYERMVILKQQCATLKVVCIAQHHFKVTCQYSHGIAILQHFAPHEQNLASEADIKRRLSAKPQPAAITREECKLEISNWTKQTIIGDEKEEETQAGINPLESFPFHARH